jgi:glyoxylase-like metal-dependent hydrolase (beta-lactamase superfamily II)
LVLTNNGVNLEEVTMTSHGWFDVVQFPHGITMIAEPGHYEDVKSFLIEGDRDVAVVDTGMGVGDFAALVRSLTSREPIVVHTHAHFDHIGASSAYERILVHESEAGDLLAGYPNQQFRRWFEPQYMADIALPDGFDPDTAVIHPATPTGYLRHGDRIDLGSRELEIYHTPGHSPGGISIFDPVAKALFPGDAIYLGPMFAFRDDSDPAAYRESLRLLSELASRSEVVYPSHNQVPLSPETVLEMHQAYEDIWAGRKPNDSNDERDLFRFDGYSFALAPGKYG